MKLATFIFLETTRIFTKLLPVSKRSVKLKVTKLDTFRNFAYFSSYFAYFTSCTRTFAWKRECPISLKPQIYNADLDHFKKPL